MKVRDALTLQNGELIRVRYRTPGCNARVGDVLAVGWVTAEGRRAVITCAFNGWELEACEVERTTGQERWG